MPLLPAGSTLEVVKRSQRRPFKLRVWDPNGQRIEVFRSLALYPSGSAPPELPQGDPPANIYAGQVIENDWYRLSGTMELDQVPYLMMLMIYEVEVPQTPPEPPLFKRTSFALAPVALQADASAALRSAVLVPDPQVPAGGLILGKRQ